MKKNKIIAVTVIAVLGTIVFFGYSLYAQVQQKQDTDKARQAISEVLQDHPNFNNPCFGSSVLTTDGTVNTEVRGKSIEEMKAYIVEKENGSSDC